MRVELRFPFLSANVPDGAKIGDTFHLTASGLITEVREKLDQETGIVRRDAATITLVELSIVPVMESDA